MLDQAVNWILGSVRDTLNLVWKLLVATFFHLPDVTALPQVQTVAGRSLLVVNTGYVVLIMVTGLVVMAAPTLQLRYGAADLLPRLVIGLVAANFATRLCSGVISGENTLVLALTGDGIASQAVLGRVVTLTTQQLTNPVAGLLVAVIGVILVVLVVLLTAGWITRFVVLIVLCAIAPLALACHGTPWTEGAARLWWRSLGGVCLTVLLQALALNISLSIFLAPGADLTRYGMPPDPSGLLGLFIVAVLLWMTVRIPALVSRYLTQSGGRQNMFAALVRLVVVQHVTRGVGQAIRGRSALAAGAASSSPLTGPRPSSSRLGDPREGGHREDRTRHGLARPVGDPFADVVSANQGRIGAHRDDRIRRGLSRAGDDPLQDLLPPPGPRPRPPSNPSTNPPGSSVAGPTGRQPTGSQPTGNRRHSGPAGPVWRSGPPRPPSTDRSSRWTPPA